MSYCRWSSDDFRCDVYVYQCAFDGRWNTHVAANRVVFQEPLPEAVPYDDTLAWYERFNKVMEIVGRAPRERIDHELAGQTLYDESPGDCARTLERLRGEGFNVPDYAIQSLHEEQRELDQQILPQGNKP